MQELFHIFLLALTPIGELRLSIPVGIHQQLPVVAVYVVSVLGNMIPPLLLMYGLPKVATILRQHSPLLDRLFEKIIIRVRKKTEKNILKYGALGLMIFVAIPLPNTGAWTGSLAAWLFDIPKKQAIVYTLMGICIAGVIVTILSLGVVQIF